MDAEDQLPLNLIIQEMRISMGYQMNWILTMITGIVTEMEFPTVKMRIHLITKRWDCDKDGLVTKKNGKEMQIPAF